LCDGGGDRVVVARLDRVTGRLSAVEQLVDEDPRAAASVAVDHHAPGVLLRASDHPCDRRALESLVSRSIDNPLHPAVTADQFQFGGQERLVVTIRPRVQQMDPGQIALAAPRRLQPPGRSDRQELGPQMPLLELPQQVVQPDAVAADHHQIGDSQTW
jgi:hypothetical protein